MSGTKRKNTTRKKLSPSEENLARGIQVHQDSPLFGRLGGSIIIVDRVKLGRDCAAVVNRDGEIFLNKDMLLSPSHWSFAIAHCKLHLAFGHFDDDKMPGYEIENDDGTISKKTVFQKYLWNTACDIYITKFLYDIKLGQPFCENPAAAYPGNLGDELKIYEYLAEHEPNDFQQRYGTATASTLDMIGLERPVMYDKNRGESNLFAAQFAAALTSSVSSAVNAAGGHTAISEHAQTASAKAARWFINHYPLLGGMASGFRIIEDCNTCIRQNIQVAAVDITSGEIYVNPAAHLTREELKFVLAHEFLHAGLQHYERCQGRDHYLWNIACDYVINGWLHEMQIGEMPEIGLLYDESLQNESAEAIYDRIVSDFRKYSRQATFRGHGLGDIIGGPAADLSGRQRPGISLDDFYKSALAQGLEYHQTSGRGYLPAGLIEEIRALATPPIPWDVELAKWFDCHFKPLEQVHSYARPSRRQSSTPGIPRPGYRHIDELGDDRTFGVIVDTSASMSRHLLGLALGAIASYSEAKEVPLVRVVFCDARAYDAGYLSPEDIAGRVFVKGRGGTVLQPGVDLLEHAGDFPKNGPILIITDGGIENHLSIRREHAFLIPQGQRLPFRAKGKIFYLKE